MSRLQLSWANLTSYEELSVESRRAGRVACENLECTSGKVLDLSRTGARLRLRMWRRPRQSQKRMLLLRTFEDEIVPFPCRIAWTRRIVWGHYEVGVEFIDQTDEDLAKLSEIASAHAERGWLHGGSRSVA